MNYIGLFFAFFIPGVVIGMLIAFGYSRGR